MHSKRDLALISLKRPIISFIHLSCLPMTSILLCFVVTTLTAVKELTIW